jgi:hypothetical protein
MVATNENGEKYCVITTPKYDWYKVVGGLQDATMNFYDCTIHEFTRFKETRQNLKPHMPKERYVSFSRLQDVNHIVYF